MPKNYEWNSNLLKWKKEELRSNPDYFEVVVTVPRERMEEFYDLIPMSAPCGYVRIEINDDKVEALYNFLGLK